jgi:hypothetical protein
METMVHEDRHGPVSTAKILQNEPKTSIAAIVDDLELLLGELFGSGFFRSIAPVACDHSRRPNCLSKALPAKRG